MKEKLKGKRWYICTFIITFAYRMLRIRGVYGMRVATDEAVLLILQDMIGQALFLLRNIMGRDGIFYLRLF